MDSAGINLEWHSKADILAALNDDIMRGSGADHLAPGRMVPWALNGCVFLPSLLKHGSPSLDLRERVVTSIAEVSTLDTQQLVDALAEALASWLL
jgi:hypothetical protein